MNTHKVWWLTVGVGLLCATGCGDSGEGTTPADSGTEGTTTQPDASADEETTGHPLDTSNPPEEDAQTPRATADAGSSPTDRDDAPASTEPGAGTDASVDPSTGELDAASYVEAGPSSNSVDDSGPDAGFHGGSEPTLPTDPAECAAAADCDDADACTDDACVDGNCVHRNVDFDDRDVCTVDACDAVTGVSHTPIDVDDGNPCTVDSCHRTRGVSHAPVDVDDGNFCTQDACDPASGITHEPVNVDDNNVCTRDSCSRTAEVIVHAPLTASDGNACTIDSCDPVDGFSHRAMGPADLDDDDACTVDSCDPNTGVVNAPVSVDDLNPCTLDTCDSNTGVVANTPVAVDDSNACTVDTCDPGTGAVVNTPVSVDDLDDCTTDACDPGTGAITHTPIAGCPPLLLTPEVEPNDSAATANVLQVSGERMAIESGSITPGNHDWYTFTASAGDRIWVMTDTGGALNGGATSRDTVIDLYAADGTSVIESDDDDGTGNGGDGTVETGLSSNIAGRTLTAGGTYYIRVRAFSGAATVNPYRLYVTLTGATTVAGSESNDTLATASAVTNGTVVSASIGAAADLDYYSFTATAGELVQFNVDGDPERDGVGTDTVVELRDAADVVLLTVDSSTTGSGSNPPAESATFVVASTGSYFVRVRHFSAASTGTYHFTVSHSSFSVAP